MINGTRFLLVVPLTAEFQGLRDFLFLSQLESPHSMRIFLTKVKQFVKIYFKKNRKKLYPPGKNARFPAICPRIRFFVFLSILHVRVAATIRNTAKYDSFRLFLSEQKPIRWFLFNKKCWIHTVGWKHPTRRVIYIYSTHLAFVKHHKNKSFEITKYLCDNKHALVDY